MTQEVVKFRSQVTSGKVLEAVPEKEANTRLVIEEVKKKRRQSTLVLVCGKQLRSYLKKEKAS